MTGMTETQKVHWEANGFLTIPDALQGDELQNVQEAADEVEARWRADIRLSGARSVVLEQVQAPIEYDERLLELLWHPRTFPMVREILGPDVAMIDNDFLITPPRTPSTHADWHHDVDVAGVEHSRSTLMVKTFFLLSDVNEDSGGTAMVPGSHRFPDSWRFPIAKNPREMPGAVQMTGRAGTAYLFNGRVYHCAVNNDSDQARRVLIYNYGHNWMKVWPGYEPSQSLQNAARTSGDPVRQQLLGLAHAYDAALTVGGER